MAHISKQRQSRHTNTDRYTHRNKIQRHTKNWTNTKFKNFQSV